MKAVGVKVLEGRRIGLQTLVGSDRNRPAQWGNCFDMKAEDGKYYRIVNFYVENLEHCIKHGVRLPVRIEVLGGRVAVINDPRIPDEWYRRDFCTCCCPEDLLPTHQRLGHRRQELRGQRTYKPMVLSGVAMRVCTIDLTKVAPPIPHVPPEPKPGQLRGRSGMRPGWVLAPYVPLKVFKSVKRGRR